MKDQASALSPKVKYEMLKFIEENTQPTTDGHVQYINDWTDEKIAEKFGASLWQVADNRKSAIGILPTAADKNRDNAGRLGEIQRVLDQFRVALKGIDDTLEKHGLRLDSHERWLIKKLAFHHIPGRMGGKDE